MPGDAVLGGLLAQAALRSAPGATGHSSS